ncbi:class I SAM-dependent methyltransferase [Desulfosarcina sp. OttesenSCG-928-G10]|nr:class I SAM-dependent methyltransferase [Desulfosarcina sp. OttesenSCG-928-G10]
MNFLLRRCGIHLSDAQLGLLWAYHQLLRQYDAELNLTRIHNFDNMVLKLYADSMLPALHAQLPSPLMDLGTGPGMPGIPLKIFRPDLHILLAEGRKPRIAFLQTAVEALGLPGLEVIGRGIAPDFDRPVKGVITRAVESIADTLVRVSSCLVQDGTVVFMKGPRCDEEMEAAAVRFSTDYALSANMPYVIPETPHQRRLVCYRRLSAPPGPEHQLRPRVQVIESRANPVFRELEKLFTGRGVKKAGKTLVCGSRLVTDALSRHPGRCLAWITRGEGQVPPADAPPHLNWLQLAPDLFTALDVFGTRAPLLLFDVPALSSWNAETPTAPGCTLLVPFQDPENVGAVIRCAAAFDVDRVVLLSESANPFHPKAIRASAGTVFAARLFQGPSLEDLPDTLPLIALSATGSPLSGFSFPDRFCLLAGMEGPGIPARLQARGVAIPMAGGVESLNAAVAAAIALYAWRQG